MCWYVATEAYLWSLVVFRREHAKSPSPAHVLVAQSLQVGGGGLGGSRPKTHWVMCLLSKIMILQGVKLTIQPLGVGYANRPVMAQNGGYVAFYSNSKTSCIHARQNAMLSETRRQSMPLSHTPAIQRMQSHEDPPRWVKKQKGGQVGPSPMEANQKCTKTCIALLYTGNSTSLTGCKQCRHFPLVAQNLPPLPDHWPAGQGKGATDPKYGNGLGSSFQITYLSSAVVLHASLSPNRGLRLGGSAEFLSDGT